MTITIRPDPLDLFAEWYEDAKSEEPADAAAVCLATVGADGMPAARMVLLKQADADGFVFYTNLESRKGANLAATPKAALCFHWKSIRRQIRVEGTVTAVSDDEADAYFASRPRQAQIGAWASAQSRPLEGRFELEKRAAAEAVRFGVGTVPRPPFWSGYRVVPRLIEFWMNRPFRLHDRLVYHRIDADPGWRTEWLYP